MDINLMSLCACVCLFPGSNVMRSIHGVGELMSQVVLRGGGFLPTSLNNSSNGETAKTQTEPEKQDILVMDTKLKIIEILQVRGNFSVMCVLDCGGATVHMWYQTLPSYQVCQIVFWSLVHLECPTGLQDLLSALYIQERV